MSTPPIQQLASRLDLSGEQLTLYGPDIAKLPLSLLQPSRQSARLILVSAITPTPAGEGKTTTAIGLAQGLQQLGESVCLALREPSLGPTLGKKGGATGGGLASLIPREKINLHFTGDMHAVSTAHNLLAAAIDNHLHFGNALKLQQVVWPRVLDLNDRALRQIQTGLGQGNGPQRKSGFQITAASEIMAALCLSEGAEDLRQRLDRMIVAYDEDARPVPAGEFKVTGAMLALLADALQPNLVRTTDDVPALVHGGPFANIAHGCNSVLATRMAMQLGDWAITEAGFGFDLGAEKFFDIKCRSAGLDTAAVVLVATIRALKMHGGVALDALSLPDTEAVQRGLPNLAKHIENIRCFGERPVVALNHMASDSEEEIEVLRRYCAETGTPFAVSKHFSSGGAGAVQLAETVMAHAETRSIPYRPLYSLEESVKDKILAVASKMYGAATIHYSPQAKQQLQRIEELGYARLPICVAKVPGSLSDDPHRLGRPNGFALQVRDVEINAGAGFLVVLTGKVLRMPGLPAAPAAERLDLRDGRIDGMDH